MTVGHPFATRRGRKIRAQYIQEHPMCEPCIKKGVVARVYEVHHIVPLKDGGAPLDPANFEARCEACHKRAHGARVKGSRSDGTPSDPDHLWNRA